ncbi:MAG: methylated-DNA--[protein]-cysteine S-methyltransferase [Phycisphaerales bacterium]|nr:methylated-DNA--[protein]-cysteine S-methyltransferase [Phycisphaerales bacterium]
MFDSPLGPLRARVVNGALASLDFTTEAPDGADTPEPRGPHSRADESVLRALGAHLGCCFAGQRVERDLPLAPRGTEFQRSVWGALGEIAWGETRSYADVARTIGRPEAVRAVAQAVGRNPIAILIPCHRVIGSAGTLTGYAGGLARKRALLELEGATVKGDSPRGRVSPARGVLLGAGA